MSTESVEKKEDYQMTEEKKLKQKSTTTLVQLKTPEREPANSSLSGLHPSKEALNTPTMEKMVIGYIKGYDITIYGNITIQYIVTVRLLL